MLFTRARKRCRVFSSLRHSDIRLDAARHQGPRVLARFLKYAETGELDIPEPTGGGPDSPFETSVQQVLELRGYKVASQVGSAGFRIDLAVCDTDDTGRYILAVECDGSRYHSSSWARERDRLRQQVLESKGWVFHRIWSTDWFQDQEGETRKLVQAVERARARKTPLRAGANVRLFSAVERARARKTPAAGTTAAAPRVEIARAEYAPDEGFQAAPYRRAAFDIVERGLRPVREAVHGSLVEYVQKIVEVEGPVHVDVVKRRLLTLWGSSRMGRRASDRLDLSIQLAVQRHAVKQDSSGAFLDAVSRSKPVRPRDRSPSAFVLERQPELLPPAEIHTAALIVVQRSMTATPEECTREVASILGYSTLTRKLRARIESELERLVASGTLARDGRFLALP